MNSWTGSVLKGPAKTESNPSAKAEGQVMQERIQVGLKSL